MSKLPIHCEESWDQFPFSHAHDFNPTIKLWGCSRCPRKFYEWDILRVIKTEELRSKQNAHPQE
jgi:hypothetical protein